jgi:predicted DNA-binding transcriptional regulator AlpA
MMSTPNISPDANVKFLTVDQVAERYNTSKASIWRWQKANKHFPLALKIGPNCTRWRLADLEAFEAHLSGFSISKFPSPYDKG